MTVIDAKVTSFTSSFTLSGANAHKKIVLFIPNLDWKKEDTFLTIPHSIAVLSAILSPHYDVAILDAQARNLTPEATAEALRALRPDAVMMSGLATFHHPKSIHFSMALSKRHCPDAVTVLGGVYPTVSPAEAIKDENVDFIFVGHAEERVVEFIETVFLGDLAAAGSLPGVGTRDPITQKLVMKPVKTVIGQVARQVQPDYTKLDLNPYLRTEANLLGLSRAVSMVKVAPLLTSYGCPYRCTFCATQTVSGRLVGYRPMEDVFAEIDYLVKTYGVQQILPYDDNLLLRRERIEALCNAFIEKRWGEGISWKTAGLMAYLLDDELLELMAKSGCTEIRISVESGSERVSKELVKKPIVLKDVPKIVRKCHEVGILIRGQFVIGFPGETWEEIRETFKFAEDCDFDLSHFAIATPLPSTELYDMAAQLGSLTPDYTNVDPNINGWNTGFIHTSEFTPMDLAVLRTYEWDRINFSTPKKRENIAKMYNMTLEQLEEHRRATRAALGAYQAEYSVAAQRRKESAKMAAA